MKNRIKISKIKTSLALGLLALITAVGGTASINHPASADGETMHNLTITKETIDNKEGEFTYKIKAFTKEANKFADIAKINDVIGYKISPRKTIGKNAKDLNGAALFSSIETTTTSGVAVIGPGTITMPSEHYSFIPIDTMLENSENTIDYFSDILYEVNGVNLYKYILSTPGGTSGYIDDQNPFYEISPSKNTHALSFIPGIQYSEPLDVYKIYSDRIIDETYINDGNSIQLYYVKQYTIDLSSEFGQADENGYYSFTLSNNESKTIVIPDGCTYEVWEESQDGWDLVSINGDANLEKATGKITKDETAVFLNKSLSQDEPEQPVDPVVPEVPEDPTVPSLPSAPSESNEIAVPMTGENNLTLVGLVATLSLTALCATGLVLRHRQQS